MNDHMIDRPTTADSTPTMSERMRRDWYLEQLDWHLESRVPTRTRTSIVRSLRDEIDADPRDLGDVLGDLGSPRVLAERYAEGASGPRPHWSAGAIWAGVALGLYWIVFGAYVLGMLAVVESTGAGRAESNFLSVPVEAVANGDAVGIGFTGGIAWIVVPLVIVAVVFAIGSRIWRLTRRSHDD